MGLKSYQEEMYGHGYNLMPLAGHHKRPRFTGWRNIKRGEWTPERLAAECRGDNYGIPLSAQDLVIDIDPRNFSPATDRPLTRLVEAIGEQLPDTLTVKTGGGGLHLYFRKPADIRVRHTLSGYPGLEFSSEGRFLVGPGSVHPKTGATYELVRRVADVPVAPASLLTLLSYGCGPDPLSDREPSEEAHAEGDADRYVRYLQSGAAGVAVEGESGDHHTYRVAAVGRDMGLTDSQTLDCLLSSGWNDRCEPPWTVRELEQKVRNVYRYARSNAGRLSPEKDFDVLPEGGPETVQPRSHAAIMADSGNVQNFADANAPVSWQTNKNGEPTKCLFNLLNYLKYPAYGLDRLFAYNAFSGQQVFTRRAPWHSAAGFAHDGGAYSRSITDTDLKMLKAYLSVNFNYEMPITVLEEAVTVVGYSQSFHPVREYLSGLTWDGISRLDTWLHRYAGADDSAYVRAVSRKMLVAAVRRVLWPGCQYDYVVVLEGQQGIGKSTICRIMGSPWVADFPMDPHDRDTVQALQGKWLVELPEMALMKRHEMNALKAFITRPVDKCRPAFGRLSQEYPRQCVFIGTINPEADGSYLTDETGNRRFWPVRIRQLNKGALEAARDQLWAEAFLLAGGTAWLAGHHKITAEETYMETKELDVAAAVEAAKRMAEHPFTEAVAVWVERRAAEGELFLTTRDIFIGALGGIDNKMGQRESRGIAAVMRQLGWVSGTERRGSIVVRGYHSPSSAPATSTDVVLGDLL